MPSFLILGLSLLKDSSSVTCHPILSRYAEKALGRLGLEPRLTPAQMCVARGRLDRWREVVAFYVLRLSLAPLLESLILLDRVMYLAENGE